RPPRSPPFPYTTLFRSRTVVASSLPVTGWCRGPAKLTTFGTSSTGPGLNSTSGRGTKVTAAATTPREPSRRRRLIRERHREGRRSEEHTSELQSRGHLV